MLKTFFRHYFELPQKAKNIVCLGGGVGTAQLLKGLREGPYDLTAVVSMADDGGSAGRLRRAFAIPPPGDLINCLAALSSEESVLNDLFLYRFKGKRYGKDTDLGGQKLGNLIFAALSDIYKGDTNKALETLSKIISSRGQVLPATVGDVNIWARTKNGKKVYGEKNIDLGKYDSGRSLKEVHLDPQDAKAYKPTIAALKEADAIIVGPGDLFSTVLPVLIVSQIKEILKGSHARKIFITNIANKPFETPHFKVSDFIKTIKDHIDADIFDTIIVNTNWKPKIPKIIRYHFVKYDRENLKGAMGKVVEGDFVNDKYPLYHDSFKIAQTLDKLLV